MTDEESRFGDWLLPRLAQALLDYYAGECTDERLKAELTKLADEVRAKREEIGDG